MSSESFKGQLLDVLPSLRAYALSLTRSTADADDAVQETLLRAWKSRHTFKAGSHFKAWIFRILKNVLITTAGKRRPTVDLEDVSPAALAAEPDQEWRLQFAEMQRALQHLSPEVRESLLLVVAAGLSYEDAAIACGRPVGTVKSQVNRGRAKLERQLSAEEAQLTVAERLRLAAREAEAIGRANPTATPSKRASAA